ncbi:chaperone/peptidyl-prolyl cis-trans isomerase SurA [Anopheles sinensis]|uniref:Chaperone/peptidyl-prolyl cis-trans isomerase SurA n=1 Tax=Anopheles sinensis TaxID=74873 RepID=A0A084WNW8_ANOSI|nr:chaperone/peptidyl-prolyl cis-trans isomerase SurA [Anopheles sinensis]
MAWFFLIRHSECGTDWEFAASMGLIIFGCKLNYAIVRQVRAGIVSNGFFVRQYETGSLTTNCEFPGWWTIGDRYPSREAGGDRIGTGCINEPTEQRFRAHRCKCYSLPGSSETDMGI